MCQLRWFWVNQLNLGVPKSNSSHKHFRFMLTTLFTLISWKKWAMVIKQFFLKVNIKQNFFLRWLYCSVYKTSTNLNKRYTIPSKVSFNNYVIYSYFPYCTVYHLIQIQNSNLIKFIILKKYEYHTLLLNHNISVTEKCLTDI